MRRVTGLMIFCAALCGGQTRGVVRDAAGGERLERVRVMLACGARTETAQTGPGGRFELALDAGPGCVLSAQAVGYRPVRVEMSGAGEVEVGLTPDTLTRRESVEVKAGPFETAVEESPSERTLSGVEMKNLAGVLVDDPLRAVQALPGVASSKDYVAQFSVRGAAFERVGVWLDGVLLHSPFHTVQTQEKTGSMSIINADLIEEVTLHAGAPPVMYGDRTAAVVDMRLREGGRAAPAVRVNAGVASTGAIVEGPLGRARRGSWLAAARKSYLQYLLRRSTADDWLAFGFTDAEGRLTLELGERQQVTFSILDGRSDLDRTEVRSKLGINSIMNGSYHATVGDLSWRWAPAGQVLVAQRVAWMRERAENVNNAELALGGMGYGEWVWSGSVLWNWSEKAPLAAGGAARRLHDDGFSALYNFNPLALRRRDNWHGTGVRGGGWVQQGWTAGRVMLGAGLRVDGETAGGPAVASPHGSALVRISDRTRVQAAWSEAAQYPALMARLIENMGSPWLAPERASHVVAAVEQMADERTRVRVEYFYRAERDLIAQPLLEPRLLGDGRIFVPPAAPRYMNSVRGTARGVEVFVQRRSANRMSGWVSYGWVKTRMRDGVTGAVYPADSEQRHTVNAYGSWRVTPGVNVSARYSYGSNFPMPGFLRWENGLYYLDKERNRLRLPAYHRVDFRINKTFHHETAKGWAWRGVLYFEAMNLTNRKNTAYDAFHGFNAQTGQAYPGFLKLFPVVPAAGVMVEWEAGLRRR